jgi:thiamine biosynthesis lipoprotein
VAVTSRADDSRSAAEALEAAQAEVAACESALSRFDPRSDLCRLNEAGGKWVEVDPRLADALGLALRARKETGGRFDPTVLPALAAAGYDRSFELLLERPSRAPGAWRAGGEVELEDGRARLGPGVAVDLGGIGKGYAAVRALRAMRDAWPELPGALVDLGGDIALQGEPPEGGRWRIAVKDPRSPGSTAGMLLLDGGGVATSGRDVRRFGPGGTLHHLIDPSTGVSAAQGPLAVTVVARDAVEAELHATVLAMADVEKAAEHVARQPQISAVYVPHEGPSVQLGEPPLAATRLVLTAA